MAAIELVGATPCAGRYRSGYLHPGSKLPGDGIGSSNGRHNESRFPVHLYGQPADMPAIRELARRHGLYVIEDCAQSHGANLAGRMTGHWDVVAAFSSYLKKNLGALGDGGMVVTDDSRIPSVRRPD